MESMTFKSTNVESASYDPHRSLLIVTFDGNRKYQYNGVPLSLWKRFKKTGSPGSFVGDELKSYGFRRL